MLRYIDAEHLYRRSILAASIVGLALVSLLVIVVVTL